MTVFSIPMNLCISDNTDKCAVLCMCEREGVCVFVCVGMGVCTFTNIYQLYLFTLDGW